MKYQGLILISAMLLISSASFTQSSSGQRAARAGFAAAENNYKRGAFDLAARDYEIVISNIPATTDSRKNLEIRLESLVRLADIYFNKNVDLTLACETLDIFFNNMNIIRSSNVLRASDLLDFQRKEKEFELQYLPKCNMYRNLDSDMEEFKKKFEEEFE